MRRLGVGGGLRIGFRLAASVAALVLWPTGPVAAQDRAEFNRLFQQLLADPADPDLNLRFADAAEGLGDYETAVAALERLLILYPDSANLRLRLGEDYAHLGSYAMARAYLEPLAAASDLPPALRAQAAASLGAVAGATSPHKFSLQLFAGSQWQTDPAAAPGSPLFLFSAVPTTVPGSAAKRSDNDIFGQAVANYAYDLGTRAHDAIEIGGFGYASSYRRLHQLDSTIAEITLGPRIGLGHIGVSGGGIKPYLVLDGVRLGGALYSYAYGGGVNYQQALPAPLPRVAFDYRVQNNGYHATANYPSAALLSGRSERYALDLTEPLAQITSLGVGALLDRQSARFPGFANSDYALTATLSVGYDTGPLSFGYPFVTSVTLARHFITYDAPDPTVNAAVKRGDHRWQISVSQIVPVTSRLSITAVVYRDIQSSNLINYAYTNTSFMVGPQLSF